MKYLDKMNDFRNKTLIKNLLNERFSIFKKLNINELALSEGRKLIMK
jgi:hypothetical protein